MVVAVVLVVKWRKGRWVGLQEEQGQRDASARDKKNLRSRLLPVHTSVSWQSVTYSIVLNPSEQTSTDSLIETYPFRAKDSRAGWTIRTTLIMTRTTKN